jgi:hypothetical protein
MVLTKSCDTLNTFIPCAVSGFHGGEDEDVVLTSCRIGRWPHFRERNMSPPLVLKETVCFSEKLVPTNESAWCQNPDNHHHHDVASLIRFEALIVTVCNKVLSGDQLRKYVVTI